jgi:NADH-quinone oxidoreductase subunit L
LIVVPIAPLPLLPLLPVVTALGVVALRSRFVLASTVAVGGLVATLVVAVWAAIVEPMLSYRWSSVIELHYGVTGFSRVMVVLVPLIAAPVVAYAAATEGEGRGRLIAVMSAFVGGMLLLVGAADLITLLIAWELIGALSWWLIGHAWRRRDDGRAAAQAFITTRVGDLGLYVAAGALFAGSGSFAFEAVGSLASPWRDIVAGGVLLAAAAKSAQVPFSPWLFAAMAGPTPVSALLHSATLVAAGAYLLIQLSPALATVGWFLPAVMVVGVVTALAGGVVATVQTHAKRSLAGSTSAQYGLMFIAVGAGFPAAAAAHLITHAAFKSLLFLGAGTAIHVRGTPLLERLRLGRALPVTAGLSMVGALALAAIPPLGGAWSKEQVLAGALERSTWLGVGALGAGFLSAAYAARYQLLAYGPADPLTQPAGVPPDRGRGPGPLAAGSMGVLALVTVALSGLWLPGAGTVLADVTATPLPPSSIVETVVALVLAAVAVIAALWLRRRGRLVDLALPAARQRAMEDWLGLPRLTMAAVVQPVVGIAADLRRFDERVIDAGVRATGRIAELASRLIARRFELAIEGTVAGVATTTLRLAQGAREADDAGLDAAVEAAGRGVGVAGHQSRRLQTGQSHQYFVIVAAGVAMIVALLAVAR